jgi:hypothetical protein
VKTEELIPLLAARLVPQDRHAVLRRFCIALSAGAVAAVAAVALSLGVRPDLAGLLITPLFWGKLAFPFLMATASVLMAARLAIPGAWTGGRAWLLVAAPFAAIWAAALAVLGAAPAESRETLLFGHTWTSCPFFIALLSIPSYLALSWAMRGLAPTRLRLAGASVGLLSGAVGAMAYVLRCPEMNVPFWALWYPLGMAIPALAGCLLARVSFRWW